MNKKVPSNIEGPFDLIEKLHQQLLEDISFSE